MDEFQSEGEEFESCLSIARATQKISTQDLSMIKKNSNESV